jgi:hypothetical protein
MRTISNLWPEVDLAPEDARRVAVGINEILKGLGRQPEDINGWWNSTPFPELGGKTPTQAWLSGDYDGVRRLVELLITRSVERTRQIAQDPEMMAFLREQLAKLG